MKGNLHKAVERGEIRTVRTLLEEGYDPNIPDPEGRTPLILAVISGNPEMVMLLLSCNADPFFDGFHDIPVFMASSFFGHLELVKLFMDMGFDMINYRSSWGDTALSYASKRNFPDIVRFIISSGSDLNVKNRYGVTPLIAAAYQGNDECCSILVLSGANVNETDNLGRSVLRHAIRARCEQDMVKLLLSRGADPLIKDRKGHTVFWEPFSDEYLSIILDHYSFFYWGERFSLQEIMRVFRMTRKEGKDPSELFSVKKIPPEALAPGGM